MTELNRLFNPVQRQRLVEAIPNRASCRSYRGAPSYGNWASLAYAAERYRLPGARLALCRVDDALFTGTLLNMGRIVGCEVVAAVIASGEEPMGRLHAGILGEAFVLEATSLGLGSCWVSGTYRRKLLQIPLKPEEAVLCIIAVGQPEPGAMDTKNRRRKPVERLIRGSYDRWSASLRDVAQAVRLAPSAMNMQPWQMALEEGCFILDGSDRSSLELGVALCHAELTLPPHGPWQFADRRSDPFCWTAIL